MNQQIFSQNGENWWIYHGRIRKKTRLTPLKVNSLKHDGWKMIRLPFGGLGVCFFFRGELAVELPSSKLKQTKICGALRVLTKGL